MKKDASKSGSAVELYDKLIATIPEIKRKGAANPYTSHNGNMFTLLHQSSRLAIRLPEDKRDEEYVAVPDSMLKNSKELQRYLASSYEYVKTLKPKATKKKS